MARRKVLITVYLEPEQMEWLRGLSQRSRVAAAVYVRDGLELLRAKMAAEAPREQSWDETAGTHSVSRG